jgi:hypothetical protein
LSIQQDFYAKIVASNLTALMEIAAQKKAVCAESIKEL